MCVVGGLRGAFAALHSPCGCLSFPALPEDPGGTGSAGWAHRKSAKKGSALALMGVGGSLPGSFLLLLFVKFE